ncbi:protein-L-isoaspartate O-methyltransferase [Pneumocystis murina B123]|uniref:protein-L-isoaspartate(D-aspartate) O-methyltransferase n=1 Tax=Pneumocystis murina (strain B123) TaxID=1069680 RepID=M7NIL9_PNEMU|nr:protein-L-isoaspartate O-methyltransferase [Pneumocystis murina B123]EMR08433.2 protein-L-isoaspartate O-methyltransferase [Pneumocystis murina B123]
MINIGSKTHIELIENLKKANIIKSERVYNTMLSTDRALFCPSMAYEDAPQYIGYGATSKYFFMFKLKLNNLVSAPHMHAISACLLEDSLRPGSKALDIGCGSGYFVALLAKMIQPGGIVVGVEHIKELAEQAKENLKKMPDTYEMLKDGRIKIICADGRLGYPKEGPYDVCHVGACAKEIYQTLKDQLKENGRMVIPVGDEYEQYIMYVYKDINSRITVKRLSQVKKYVPLTDLPKNYSSF